MTMIRLISGKSGDTQVLHLLHPAIDLYPNFLDYDTKIQKECGSHRVAYFAEQDSFVFYVGDTDTAREISQKIIMKKN